ncbi:uncharacterized protein F4812DRAFT_460571 [Daldinia caldariorum]|uniref:uncharacterized protein n=1 Tax=Daldinia caldariorum TaxID=326644 RepID=UPI002007E7E1|nr:uncharacterized protein F4812DRAFT_460571 [Daldinia caldariorum]KAI1466298.1 hypothetical protein F4812DRAFT_460571 [Daldinia caldariorum]
MAPPAPGFKLNENGIPNFEDLPLRKTDPHYSAWGLYGDKDELGTLNRLTDELVAAAAKGEIKTGHRISLNWPLNAQRQKPFFQRHVFSQTLIRKAPRVVNDDVWTFNTQVSTQWDGLRHYAYQEEARFYNGVTMDDIHGAGEDGEDGGRTTVNGIHAWAEQGIVGRGVLIDYHSWRLAQPADKRKPYDPFQSDAIPLEDLQACLAAQGTEVKFGDILFIRSGTYIPHTSYLLFCFIATYPQKTDAELAAYRSVVPHHFGGVERSEALLRWIWERFSAVAGDQPSFESWPAPPTSPHILHEVLLAGWGCPIGELFDLEKLGAHCAARGRWSFFVASEPCNVPGGVASPPNILAIF